jgi:hypothetical protein
MANFSRRVFLRSSVIAAAAGAVSAVPGVAGLLGTVESDAPALPGAAAEVDGVTAGAADATGPIVAHVRDLSTGEIGILNGTREVILRDPQLVARLLRAAR